MEKEQFYYDNKIVKMFLIATILWGVVGMLVGLIVALLFIFPNMLEGISWLSFGRLRPLHTNAVIFAFVGNSIFMGIYYSMQRLLKTRMFKTLSVVKSPNNKILKKKIDVDLHGYTIKINTMLT